MGTRVKPAKRVCILCHSPDMCANWALDYILASCKKHLPKKVFGMVSPELLAASLNKPTFCQVCFDNSFLLSSLNKKLDDIQQSINTHVTKMARIIEKRRNIHFTQHAKASMSVVNAEPEYTVMKPRGIYSRKRLKKSPEAVTITKNDDLFSMQIIANSPMKLENITVQPGFLDMSPEAVHLKEVIDEVSFADSVISIANCSTSKKDPLSLEPRIVKTQKCMYRCNRCTLAFKKSTTLNKHKVDVHSEVKRIPCPSCRQSFTTLRRLENHKICKHPSFKCKICNQTFGLLAVLEHHLITMHEGPNSKMAHDVKLFKFESNCNQGNISHPCTICKKSFSTQTQLKKHNHVIHNMFGCKICDQDFDSKGSLISHTMLTHHNNILQVPLFGLPSLDSDDIVVENGINVGKDSAMCDISINGNVTNEDNDDFILGTPGAYENYKTNQIKVEDGEEMSEVKMEPEFCDMIEIKQEVSF